MPKASIVTISNRVGGLDVLCDSLERQTEKDFELIFVDALYDFRDDIVTQNAKRYSFPVQHLPPMWPNQFPRPEQCRAFNTAFVAAKSDLIIFECDYTWLHEDTVATHVGFQEKFPGCCWMGDFNYAVVPPHVCPSYATTAHPTSDEIEFMLDGARHAVRYHEDLKAGKLDHLMWSIFDTTPVPPFDVNYEHKRPNAELGIDNDWNYFSFKNESVPLDLLLDINGIDMSYDGSHSYPDSEVAYRLREYGAQLFSGPRGAGAVTCLNTRDFLNCRVMDRPRDANGYLLHQCKRADKRVPVNPGMSLREMRDGWCTDG